MCVGEGGRKYYYPWLRTLWKNANTSNKEVFVILTYFGMLYLSFKLVPHMQIITTEVI